MKLFDEGGHILMRPRTYCPVCQQHELIEWHDETGEHALCLNTNCEYEF